RTPAHPASDPLSLHDALPISNIGTVGLTEEQARERLGRITVYRSEFRALRHTLSGSSERTLMKLVVDEASDRVVGLHMVGAEARSEEHTSELQSRENLVCRLL